MGRGAAGVVAREAGCVEAVGAGEEGEEGDGVWWGDEEGEGGGHREREEGEGCRDGGAGDCWGAGEEERGWGGEEGGGFEELGEEGGWSGGDGLGGWEGRGER